MPAAVAPKRFGLRLTDLLMEKGYVGNLGQPNLRAFAKTVKTYHYETIRKAAAEERFPTTELMEAVATALGVPPTTFYEYELALAARDFDPNSVGLEQALENVEKWARQKR